MAAGVTPVQLSVALLEDPDPTSTNVYLANLSPTVDEPTLCRDFGSYGPLASVKILWPRTPEEKLRGRNSGFVAFMRREDAEKALLGLQGHVYGGLEARLAWGKGVVLPAVPIYVALAPGVMGRAAVGLTGLPFNASMQRGPAYTAIAPPGAAPQDTRLLNTLVTVRQIIFSL